MLSTKGVYHMHLNNASTLDGVKNRIDKTNNTLTKRGALIAKG